MKKIVIAFVAGALLMVSGQALAEQITLVGKKVGSEAKVILNGKEISNAVIINSKSYAPVRDISESFGANVEYDRGVITIETSDAIANVKARIKVLEAEKMYVEKQITETQQIIEYQLSEAGPIAKYEKILETPHPNADVQKSTEEALALYKANHEEYKQKFVDWQTKLEQINAEIAELQAL